MALQALAAAVQEGEALAKELKDTTPLAELRVSRVQGTLALSKSCPPLCQSCRRVSTRRLP